MRVFFITDDFGGASLCARLHHEGHDVRAHVGNPGYRHTLDGWIGKVGTLDEGIAWVGTDGLVVCDDNGFGGMNRRDWLIFLLSWLIARLARRSAPYLLHRPLCPDRSRQFIRARKDRVNSPRNCSNPLPGVLLTGGSGRGILRELCLFSPGMARFSGDVQC